MAGAQDDERELWTDEVAHQAGRWEDAAHPLIAVGSRRILGLIAEE